MTPHAPGPYASDPRESLDEALFATGEPIVAPDLPDLPDEALARDEPSLPAAPVGPQVLVNEVVPRVFPSPIEGPPDDHEVSYQFPHPFEDDVACEPQGADQAPVDISDDLSEDRPDDLSEDGAEWPVPEEEPPPLTVSVNAGLTLVAGDSAVLTPDRLQVTGADAPHLIDLMLLSPPLAGAVLRDGFALTGGDVFTQEDIDQGRVSYRHAGGEELEDSFTFATSDGAVPPTVFSVTIEPRHCAPLLSGPGQLNRPLEGLTVVELLGESAHCPGGEQPGIALVAVQGRGAWDYSLDAGANWRDVGHPQHGAALLLGPDDRLRFTPRNGWSGPVKLTYRAWDQTAGGPGERVNLAGRHQVGGSTAYSQALAAGAATIAAPAAPALPPAAEPWVGQPTAEALAGQGLAVVRLVGEGTWQFSPDAGRTWRDFGPVYHGRARLLRPADRVRFLPRPGWQGRVALAARTWDGTGEADATVNLAAASACGEGTPFGEDVQVRAWYRAA